MHSVSAATIVPTSNLPTPKDVKMLDKLKLFGSKDKSSASATVQASASSNNSPRLPKSSTRASNSSSGFSSAKSELSEVSSFADQQQTPSPSGYSSKLLAATSSSPKLAIKSSTNKKNITKSSPKPSKKEFKKSSSEQQSNDNKLTSGSAQTSPQLMKKQKTPIYEPSNAKSDKYQNMDDFNPNAGKSSLPATSKLKPVTSPTCSQIPGFGVKGCIPKPTLAVKGMKPVSSSKQLNECPNDAQQTTSSSVTSSLPGGYGDPLSNQMKHSNSSMEQIVSVTEREKFLQNYKAQRSYSSAMMKTSNPSSPVTVGVVSPITHHKKLPLTTNNSSNSTSAGTAAAVPIIGAIDLNSSLDSQGGHQSDSNSSHTSGNQSDTASVIYCPSADEKECASSGISCSNNYLRRNKSKSPASLSDDSSMQKLR